MKCNRSGFSLIELLVVVLIITILATIVGVRVLPELAKAKTAKATAQISNFCTGLKLYQMDTGRLPTREQGLAALCEKPVTDPVPEKYREGGYLESKTVPLDPWGREYVYLVPGSGGKPYEIVCYGADGEPGGEGEDVDLSSLGL